MFWTILSIFAAQRLLELAAAKFNEKNALKEGAVEYGKRHYPYIVALHVLFFVSLIWETIAFQRGPLPMAFVVVTGLIFTQALRYWALFSLGRCWNTKILVIPGTNLVRKGPYQWFKHPNYVAVALEFLLLPLLFQAYATALLFTVLNAAVMYIRIRTEEQALEKLHH
ncbi:hypothetical protein MOF42_07915 [Bacillus haynesii]|uniref:isoprenylcysteine carboxyl methyltransferase family protein n=1 Tax=Bacillus haynesii TaxID=1925021 RepID=UPI00227EC1D9|nr:isoprenylcysteine carboxylmethyltransferase family protein [Bacillus haynesii]MCY8669231.1 hypothetical protein [Bacillus haynesii]MCY9387097.1 hypothetical protein [Bacillus haynesii]